MPGFSPPVMLSEVGIVFQTILRSRSIPISAQAVSDLGFFGVRVQSPLAPRRRPVYNQHLKCTPPASPDSSSLSCPLPKTLVIPNRAEGPVRNLLFLPSSPKSNSNT